MAAAVALTNDCIKDGNAVEATSKAAASAWRSSQARVTPAAQRMSRGPCWQAMRVRAGAWRAALSAQHQQPPCPRSVTQPFLVCMALFGHVMRLVRRRQAAAAAASAEESALAAAKHAAMANTSAALAAAVSAAQSFNLARARPAPASKPDSSCVVTKDCKWRAEREQSRAGAHKPKAPAHQLGASMPASQQVLCILVVTCQSTPERLSVPAGAQAKDSALAAARAEAAAANNALKTVETGINYYAMRKEYLKLKDIAEASDVAGKVFCRPRPSGRA